MGKHTHLKPLRPDTLKKVYEYRMHENVFLHTSVMLSTFYSKFINIKYLCNKITVCRENNLQRL